MTLTAVCVASCVVFEYLYNKIMKRTADCRRPECGSYRRAAGIQLPVQPALWMAIVGCFAAIVVVKQLFGGIGQNLVNPAVTARVFMFIAFATEMTSWPTAERRTRDRCCCGCYDFRNSAGRAFSRKLCRRVQMTDSPRWICSSETSEDVSVKSARWRSSSAVLFLIWKRVISPIIPVTLIATYSCWA